jgi:flavin reductase (DIM6/NTAB) family NADH-FMN oxidoreductase RutF
MGSNAPDQSSATFDTLVSGLDYPMVVVTVASGADRAGCLVGFSTQCSIDPARYAVCISKQNRTADVAARIDTMVVHFLRPNDTALARLFGEETDDEIPKFDRCAWHPGPDDTPVIADCDWFGGRIVQRIDVGDHVLHVLDLIDAGKTAPARPGQLGFQAVKDLDPGHNA